MDRLALISAASTAASELPRTQINNELANVSTLGFKRSYANAMRTFKVEGPGFDSRFNPTNTYADRISLAPGPMTFTGNPMDIAMNGSTVLGVTATNGELAYTRRGDLRVNAQGMVVTGTGHAVRGQDGGNITAPTGFLMHVTEDGSVYASNPARGQGNAAPQLVGRLFLRDASETPLERRPDGLFQPTGPREVTQGLINDGKETPSVSPNNIEGSNVSAYESMIKLIEHTRSFETAIKVIKEAKSLDESGATMMKVA